MKNKYRKILALVLSLVMVTVSFTHYADILAEDTTNNAENDTTGIITGTSGDRDGYYWEFNPGTETLSFYGFSTSMYQCDEIADKVKHIVFTEKSTDIEVDRAGSKFPNLEDVTFSPKVFIYDKGMFKESTNIKEYIVDEENPFFLSIDGDLYDDDYRLFRYAVGKGESTVYLSEKATYVYYSAFYGNTKTTKVVVPESVETIDLPLSDGALIDDIEIQNPNCKINFGTSRTVNEDLVIHSYAGSYVESQCMGYEIDFQAINSEDIESVEIAELPENMSVIRGLKYTPNGLGLQINYKDGRKRIAHYGFDTEVDTSKVGKTNVEVTFAGMKANFEIEVEEIPESSWLKQNDAMEVTLQTKEKAIYYFEPEESGTYRIYTEGEYDTTVSVYDNNTLLKTDEDSGSQLNGQVDISFEAGKVYQIKVSTAENNTVTFNLKADFLNNKTDDGIVITNTLLRDYIEPGENLEIKYTVSGLADEQQLYYGEEPARLEKSEAGVWTDVPLQSEIDWSDNIHSLTEEATVSVDLAKYYGELNVGEYRYTHLIGNKEISTIFNIFDVSLLDRENVLSTNETRSVSLSGRGGKKTFYFRATLDDKYTFYTTGDYDTYVTLNCLSDGTTVVTNDDSGSNNNFYIAKQLKAGYVYELIISTYSYGEQTFDLVTKMSCLHKYLESIEKASCKREGKIIYTCKYCLDNYEIEIPKTDHEYEYKTIAPTCTEKGYTHVGCKNCDYSKDENYVDALGHDYDIVTVYPKEGKDGYVAHICRTCNDIFKTEYVEESKVEEITTTNTRIDTTTATTKSIETKVSKTKIRKLTAGKKKVKISWKKIKGVKGYQVKISKQKNFKKSITKNVKVTKITIKKLKSKQKYYVKVRSYKIISGAKKYSDWSKIGKIRTK